MKRKNVMTKITTTMPIPLILFLAIEGCNPYMTKKINRITKQERSDTIYVAYPIIETRRQFNINSFYKDTDKDIHRSTDSFTKKALHDLFDKSLPVQFADLDSAEYLKTKILLEDSILKKLMYSQLENFKINKSLPFQTERDLILIPYLVWTRSTEDYQDWGEKNAKCQRISRWDYSGNHACQWTQLQTLLLMIDRGRKEVVYFKYSQGDWRTMIPPDELRIFLNLQRCAKPLWKKLAHRKNPPVSARL